MKYRVVVGGESCDCQLFVGFEGKPEGDATPADLIAALKANAAACAEVLAGMAPTHFAARDAEWWHDRFVAEKARAEQAEHSLAASERALAALRYQAQAGGCELSTVGENSYHCRADALCGLCRLRHRAEQAERDRDAWREKWEALETTRAVCCAQIERERDGWRARCENVMDAHPDGGWQARALDAERERDEAMTLAEERRDYARAQNAKLSVECDDLRAQLAEVERERDAARSERDTLGRRVEDAQAALNECGAGFTGQPEATRIRDLRARLAKTEAVVDAAREDAQHCPHACSPPCPFDRAVARTRAALRALDNSGGSGAATPEGGHAAPTGGPMPPPEPAGSSLEAKGGDADVPRANGCSAAEDIAPSDPALATGQAREYGGRRMQNMPTPESNEGLIPSGACRPDPPPDYLTRAELVSAVRSAASAVGGPPRRALDALADALEIPHT